MSWLVSFRLCQKKNKSHKGYNRFFPTTQPLTQETNLKHKVKKASVFQFSFLVIPNNNILFHTTRAQRTKNSSSVCSPQFMFSILFLSTATQDTPPSFILLIQNCESSHSMNKNEESSFMGTRSRAD